MHAAQPQQPRRAAASAAVPLEYFQCIYSHTTHSSYSNSQSEAERARVLPAAAAIQLANQKPEAPSSTAAGKQSSILEVQFSITDNLTAVKLNATVILQMEHSILLELLLR